MQSLSVDVQKGATFTITLVALDQVNRQVNATIHSSLSSSLGGLGENQSLQTSIDSCSDVSYNIFSPHDFETLILYADGPCKDATLSRTQVNITFKTCTCPIGFQQNRLETTKCMCECDHKLHPYISECHQQSRMLARMGTFWVTHINFSHDLNEYEYLIYPHCPLDYCYPPTLKVYINLGMERGSDKQCNYNRSGILCGRCRTNFSLSLGSSKCIQCPLHWPLFCTLIILASLLAGIALVATILYLNLTVATGVLNGIILYANIINANSSTFLPFNERNFVTVFIAWLNVELGIDTCLFEGMDTYWKTLLQLAFPSYVIILVIMVILISERSTRFASLIGRKNPVATLATLILFSYARFLHSIITILSFSVLKYPGGSYEVVWLSDGTINYLKGKHIFLFFIAVLVLLFGGAYTALLFFWQWLIYYQNKTIFRWVRYHRFRLFLEPYHAPYTFKHRYWTGLLLLVRVILYLASALNVSGDPGINLLVTGLVMVSLFLLKSCLERVKGPIYKSWPVDALETSCHINIVFLSFARFYTLESNKDQSIVAYISGTMVLILLLAVLAYNIFIQVCPMTKLHKMRRDFDEVSLMDYQPAESILGDQPHPTVSWIDAPSCKEQSLSAIVSNCESEKSDKNT